MTTSEFGTDSSFVDSDGDQEMVDQNYLVTSSSNRSDRSDYSDDMDASLILDHPIG